MRCIRQRGCLEEDVSLVTEFEFLTLSGGIFNAISKILVIGTGERRTDNVLPDAGKQIKFGPRQPIGLRGIRSAITIGGDKGGEGGRIKLFFSRCVARYKS